MKKLSLLILFIGLGCTSIAQVVESYNMVVNDDTSPLNFSFENKNIVAVFNQSDVLTFTFLKLNSDPSTKTIEIISEATEAHISVGIFAADDMVSEVGFAHDVALEKLMAGLEPNDETVYTIIVKDEAGEQNLLRFKLM